MFTTPHCCVSCSPPVVPVVRGDVAMVTVIIASSFPSSTYFSLTAFSNSSLQLLLSFAVILHSLPTLARSLLKQSPVIFSVLFASFSLPLSELLLSLQIFISHSVHVWPIPTYPFTSSFTPTSTLGSSILLIPGLSTPTVIQVFSRKHAPSAVSAVVSKPYMLSGFADDLAILSHSHQQMQEKNRTAKHSVNS